MAGLSKDLTSFVPVLAVSLAAEATSASANKVEGALLSADISGFTAMSERLMSEGKVGSERLTQLINDCFEAMIGVAYDYGGEILKFGGDALLVLFRGDEVELRGAAAGLEMHKAMKATDAATEANLQMTVGVATGPFDVFLVGSNDRELLISGPRASETITLESSAEANETVVDETIAHAVGLDLTTAVQRASGYVIDGPIDAPKPGAVDRAALDVDLQRFVPASVAAQLAVVDDLGGEHRLVTVGFVSISGFSQLLASQTADDLAAHLGSFVDALHDITQRTGVTVLHNDIGGDGAKFVLCAGAPLSSGNDTDAVLAAAVEISGIDTPCEVKIGVHAGRAFATFLGTKYRRTYTLMGDTVNTAARMMGAAQPGTVVATHSSVMATRSVFITDELEPLQVKGKAEPIRAHRVVASTAEARNSGSALNLVGRDAEVERLISTSQKPGGVSQIVGDAGSGKTRLLTELYNMAFTSGLTVFTGSCSPFGSSTPYSAARQMLRGGLGIDLDADPVSAGHFLVKILKEEAEQLLPLAPLLAVPFGAEVDDTEVAADIAAEFRRDRIQESVVELLDATMFDDPVVFVLEDAHWTDEATAALLRHLLAASSNGRNWATCITTRPEGRLDLSHFGDAPDIELGPLADEHIRSLAIAASTKPLVDQVLDRIVERSGGHALFAEQLARIASDGRDELPESIEQLLIDRIDALPPDIRSLVRTASVFGREVRLDHLASVTGRDNVADLLLEATGILTSVSDEAYEFVHALHRDTAYEGLPFTERARLHQQIGLLLETGAVDIDEIASVLSIHFDAAGDSDRAWRYGVLAGRSAAEDYAWIDAAASFRRALRHDPEHTSDAPPEVLWQELGECLLTSGNFVEAEDCFGSAIELHPPDSPNISLLRTRQAVAATRRTDYSAAFDYLDHAASGVDEHSVTDAEIRVARARLLYQQSHNQEAHDLAKTVIENLPPELPPRALAETYKILQITAEALAIPGHETFGEQALQSYRDIADLDGEAEILNNLGVSAYYRSDRSSAEDLYRRSLDLKIRCGDAAGASMARLNLAELLIERGKTADARELLLVTKRNFEATGMRIGLLFGRVLLGRLELLSAEPERAQQLLQSAADEYRLLDAEGRAKEAEIHCAEAMFLAGSYADCSTLVDNLRTTVEQDPEIFDEGPHRAGARLAILRGAILMRTSGLPAATVEWQLAMSEAQTAGADDLAAVASVLLAANPRLRRRAVARLEEIGIEHVPILDSFGFLD